MMRRILLYFITLTIPLFLGLAAWQATRYTDLEQDIKELEAVQEEWVESNKLLIAEIAVLSAAERIEYIAGHELGLSKKQPESVLQIRIQRGHRTDG
ncbi:MAG: cell division protein FtsL [Spirochaetaceae bacterium]|jgi:cell division protein FtsL|nr:cell division protein FtsL [Spirochaetaceae bacterium]